MSVPRLFYMLYSNLTSTSLSCILYDGFPTALLYVFSLFRAGFSGHKIFI